MTDYSAIFKKTVTAEEIASAILEDYPNWCSNINSARTRVNEVARERLHIFAIKKKPSVFYKVDALRITDYIIDYIKKRNKDSASSTQYDLSQKCQAIGCTKSELIDKALNEYFQRHPYEGKTYQELVELLEKRDAEERLFT
jgi:hypothetical protein